MISITDLRCEYAVNPLGLDTPQPRFSWRLESDRRGVRQAAYQILVASSPERLAASQGDKWDTGQVMSERTVNVPYAGHALTSAEACWWSVRSWPVEGPPSAWSAPATFEMGLLAPTDWRGQWITAGRVSAPLFRKELILDAPVKRARVYICGLGYHELFLNGAKVGDRLMEPAPTWFSRIPPGELRSRALYSTHDVTAQLRPGANAVGVMLGHGWFSSDDDPPQVRHAFAAGPVLILQLTVELADGRMVHLVTDTTWKTNPGPILANDIIHGEHYDARREQPGWHTTGFDDSAWSSATLTEPPTDKLVAQSVEPIRVVQRLRPVRVLPAGTDFIFDLGQYISGVVELRVRGPAGTTVTLQHAGRVNYETSRLDTRNNMFVWPARQTDAYTLKGDGEEIWRPRFTVHGFRYVQVSGYPGVPTLDDITGCVINNDIEPAGEFACSNDLLTRIHHNIRWTFQGSFQGQPQDAADRGERVGWLGDPGFVAEDCMLNFRDVRFWSKWLDDIAAAQGPAGQVPFTCPPYARDWCYQYWPCWECTYALFTWFVYRHNDDVRILEKHYDGLCKQVAWFGSQAKNHIIVNEALGDHMEPRDDGTSSHTPVRTPLPLTGTAYYQRTAWIVAQMATVLGRENDARHYAKLADEIKAAFNNEFLNRETNQYGSGSQTANALALALDLVPPERSAAVLQNLISDIEKRQGHLATGIIGTDALVRALPRSGRADVLYRIATQTTFPGWGYGVVNGQTTLAENFEGDGWHSLSMKMLGSIEKFFYQDLAGLRPTSPGWKTVEVAPTVVGDLQWVRASHNSFHGRVAIHWQRQPHGLSLEVVIPANTTATVVVPKLGRPEVVVNEGNRPVWRNGRFLAGPAGITAGRDAGSSIQFTVESGSYVFEMS